MPRSVGRVRALLDGSDILDPRSRHNLHVTRAADLEPVGEWSEETLFAAVQFADAVEDEGASRVVVLDHGRNELYVAAGTDLEYDPPRGLGFGSPPALRVASPQRFDPETATVMPADSVTVSPTFDILVPAFGWEDLDEDDVLPPMGVRPSRSPTGAGSGSPG